MTDALTRAADAVHEKHTWLSRSEAILAFLSGEDVVEACARALAHEDWTGESAEFRATRLEVSAEKAQRAIAALRVLVQEEK